MKNYKNILLQSVLAIFLGIIIFSCNAVKCPDLEQTEKSNHLLSFLKNDKKNKNLSKTYVSNQNTKIPNVDFVKHLTEITEPKIVTNEILVKNNVEINSEKNASQKKQDKNESIKSDYNKVDKRTFATLNKIEQKIQEKVEKFISNNFTAKKNIASKPSLLSSKSTSNNGMILLIVGLVLSLVGGVFAIVSPMLAILILIAGLVMFIVGLVQVLGGTDGDKGGF